MDKLEKYFPSEIMYYIETADGYWRNNTFDTLGKAFESIKSRGYYKISMHQKGYVQVLWRTHPELVFEFDNVNFGEIVSTKIPGDTVSEIKFNGLIRSDK